ncbi:MAG: endonuclease/exonuclease/phosphatase family protein [Acetobacter papayae]
MKSSSSSKPSPPEQPYRAGPLAPRFFPLKAAVLTLLAFHSAEAASPTSRSIKLSTWNLEWLLDENTPASRSAPLDIPARIPADYTLLAAFAARLNPDIAAVQEADNPNSLALVFSLTNYAVFTTDDTVLQRTGLAIRAGLSVTRHPDVQALDITPPSAPHHLRSGLDMTVHFAHADLRVLVVHLKTGCWDDPPSQTHHTCPLLVRQFKVLSEWIGERAQAGEAFAIMGDFNRRLNLQDPLFLSLQEKARLDLTTSGYASPCLGGSYFIDHIILGGSAIGWKEPDSLRVMPIPQGHGHQLSDHCPVSITLHLPA